MRRRQPDAEVPPLDPVALSLAVWLGLVVSALGLQRLSEQAALNVQSAPRNASSQVSPMQAYAAWSG